jgi:hypothetical protein
MLLEDLRTEVKAKRPSIEAKHKHHIFQGDFKAGDKDAPTGYHSKNGKTASATHEAYGGTTDVPNDVGGVYQQSVRSTKAPFKKKDYRSTFFPDDATEDDILDAITSVYGLGSQSASVTYPPKLKGMTLQKIGATIFPAGGKDLGPE